MGLIRTENAESGMVLAGDVLDANGWLLLPSGTRLSTAHIDQLRSREINEIEVQGVTQSELDERRLAALAPEVQERLRDEIEDRFRFVDLQDPFIGEVFRLTMIRRSLQLSQEG